MSKYFDFYEIAGTVMPGAILIIGLILITEPRSTVEGILSLELSIGDFGVFLLLAFALGHVIQSVGNGLEKLWWRLKKGWPTNRVGMRDDGVITGEQRKQLLERAETEFSLRLGDEGKPANERDWHIVTRRMYSDVAATKRAERIDLFNRLYGFSRGLATSFLILLILTIAVWGFLYWRAVVVLIILTLMSLSRMDRFGNHYARELFVQYLNLQASEKNSGKDE